MAMSQLLPRILSTEKNGLSMVGCCVGDELHELGMRMVSDFFEMAGWETYYMGANCPMDAVLSALDSRRADLLCLSVTMPHNIGNTRTLIREASKCSPNVKILVGGFPFLLNPRLVDGLGAHGWARDAEEAVTQATSLVRDG